MNNRSSLFLQAVTLFLFILLMSTFVAFQAGVFPSVKTMASEHDPAPQRVMFSEANTDFASDSLPPYTPIYDSVYMSGNRFFRRIHGPGGILLADSIPIRSRTNYTEEELNEMMMSSSKVGPMFSKKQAADFILLRIDSTDLKKDEAQPEKKNQNQ